MGMKGFGKSILAKVMSLLLVTCLMVVTFGVPANARFISPDNFDPTKPGVGTNRYAYAGNDPINNSDPNGHVFGIDDAAIGWAIGLGLATLGAFFGGSSPANAPGPNDKIKTKSDAAVARDMALGACMAACGSAAVRGGLSAISKTKNEDKKEVASTEQRNAKAEAGVNTDGKDYSEVFSSNGDSYSVTGIKNIKGNTVEINNIDINKIGYSSTNTSATADIKSQMAQHFAKEGFDSLTINGVRVSGANPNRTISVTIDLGPYK